MDASAIEIPERGSITISLNLTATFKSDLIQFIGDNVIVVSIRSPNSSTIPAPGTMAVIVTGLAGRSLLMRRRQV